MTMDRRSFLFATGGALLSGCASMGDESGPTAAAPVYRVGDRWTYSGLDGFRRAPITWEEVHEVIGVDAQGIAIRVTQKGPTINTSRTERLMAPGLVVQGAMFDSETRKFQVPLERYRFPLAPGARWSQFISNVDESTRQEGTINNSRSVGGWSKVTVPAGEFDTILVRDFSRLDDETPFRFATALNYQIRWSPAVGAPVREVRQATYREKNQGMFAVEHQSQDAVVELTSFRKGP
jgi:hypothetical protein